MWNARWEIGLDGQLLQPWRRLGRPHPTQIRRLYAFLEQITLRRSIQSRLACPGAFHGEATPRRFIPGAGGRGVYGATRIRSLYLPWMTGLTPQAFHHNPARKARHRSPLSMPRSRLGVTPLRTCPETLRGQTSLPHTNNRGWKPLPQGQASSSGPRPHASSFFKPSTIRLGTGFESSVR
jgi:hypothetical protein